MGQLVSIESSSYVNSVIDAYAQNRVSQYSKFLNLTPTFVTYYAVNQAESRTDTGTGSVASEIGYQSPLRFNKIKNLPVYNIPILSPDITFDESGADMELDINDITLLPDTVKPTVPDYMLVVTPDGTKALFRINNFKYNTIQSNDFVTVSADLKRYGDEADMMIEKLVVKTYYTVFDNIGTNDKCFIEEDNVPVVNSIVKTVEECSEIFNDLYWNGNVGGYVYTDDEMGHLIYDSFLTKFINDTDLFPHDATRITTLPYLDFNERGSEYLYKRSLLYAVHNATPRLMSELLYYYLNVVIHPFSPLNMYNLSKFATLSVKLKIFDSIPNGTGVTPYYDRLLVNALINKEEAYPAVTFDVDEEGNQLTDEEGNLIYNIPEDEVTLINSYTEDQKYVFNLIIQHMLGINAAIDTDKIIRVLINKSLFGYFYGPVIIYILKKEYDKYFDNSSDLLS